MENNAFLQAFYSHFVGGRPVLERQTALSVLEDTWTRIFPKKALCVLTAALSDTDSVAARFCMVISTEGVHFLDHTLHRHVVLTWDGHFQSKIGSTYIPVSRAILESDFLNWFSMNRDTLILHCAQGKSIVRSRDRWAMECLSFFGLDLQKPLRSCAYIQAAAKLFVDAIAPCLGTSQKTAYRLVVHNEKESFFLR